MKRLLILLLGLILLFPACSLGDDPDLSKMTSEELTDLQARIQAELDSRHDDYDEIVTKALSVLKKGWKEEYAKSNKPGMTFYIDIRGVRIVRIRDDLGEKEAKYFEGIKYLVDFLLYDDYISCGTFSANGAVGSGYNVGYLDYSGVKNVVTVDHDGNMVLAQTSPLRMYRAKTYECDFSTIIEEVIDFHEKYNQLMEFPQYWKFF